jgi:hypothetical protein
MTKRSITLTALAVVVALLAAVGLVGAVSDLGAVATGTTGDALDDASITTFVGGIVFVLLTLAFSRGAYALWRHRR